VNDYNFKKVEIEVLLNRICNYSLIDERTWQLNHLLTT